ncbi:pyridoxal phosphate-dependent transferase [Pisolithus orientalis]|uniref:pyridoxal phosphate-dependent transferase n=1 Tax=Pisolithus orientalis TaxID=936130 RepID=UPI002225929F|nr:pyridoxal phosphate-dependent transferase [Pisolithus orientalis]KAI6015260.1 pyridoxal phosphate-dependent transferase [Pisolithus orientalis]
MPSPIALSPSSPPPSLFLKKKKSSLSQIPPFPTAASYLSALHEADARARGQVVTPTSTPPLSISSSLTSASGDTVLNEPDADRSGLTYPLTAPTSEQVFTTVHTEFGHCANQDYRCVSQHDSEKPVAEHKIEEPPYYILFTTYFSYLLLIIFGHLRDFFGKQFAKSYFTHLVPYNGYAPLNSDFDSFYTRRLKRRMDDCFSYPVTGVAGRTILVYDRYSEDCNYTQIYPGTKTRALNISSYNYLGFAQTSGGCADAVEESIKRYGISMCGTRREGGTCDLHQTAEALVARFVGMEDALISSMGFATNSTFIPALVGKGCLVISDEHNHASIRVGVRQSGAHVRMFKHNDMDSLEALLREVISQGQPRTHRPWKKILVIVEGLYSMEGTMVNLPRVVELKQKYKFYLFVDEAHSIGALGPHGRGVTDYFNIPPRSIDVLMGTFTKSFGAAGGYVAGCKELINSLRFRGHSGPYAEAMTPPVLMQVVASMASIMGVASPTSSNPKASSQALTVAPQADEYIHPGMAPASSLPTWLSLPPSLSDGSEARERIRRLAFNSRYLHAGLKKLGFITYGHPFSPIVPLLIFNPGKMATFARMMRARRPTPIVVVVVAYPATPLVTSRVRFCVSGAHTKDDIDIILRACDEVGDILDLKHGHGERWPLEEIMKRSVELVNSL